jgi:2,3-bisphosphoglycerate-dependent phosphoglycerate mutase
LETKGRRERTRVILVRHARPIIAPDVPAESWMLAPDVGTDVEGLAESIGRYGADGVVASTEAKAHGTAEMIAHALELPLSLDPAFREQGGGQVPFLSDRDFFDAVARHFERRDEVILGSESSAQAAQRFEIGIEALGDRFACPVVVTHGRVMCAWMARALAVDPLPIWRTLLLPDALVVDLAEGTVERIAS